MKKIFIAVFAVMLAITIATPLGAIAQDETTWAEIEIPAGRSPFISQGEIPRVWSLGTSDSGVVSYREESTADSEPSSSSGTRAGRRPVKTSRARVQAAEERVGCGTVMKMGRLKIVLRTEMEAYEVTAQLFKRTKSTIAPGTDTAATDTKSVGPKEDYTSDATLLVKDPTNYTTSGTTTFSFNTDLRYKSSGDKATTSHYLSDGSGLLDAGEYKLVINNGGQVLEYPVTIKACVVKVLAIDMTSKNVIENSDYPQATANPNMPSEKLTAAKRKAYEDLLASKQQPAAEASTVKGDATAVTTVTPIYCCKVLPTGEPQYLLKTAAGYNAFVALYKPSEIECTAIAKEEMCSIIEVKTGAAATDSSGIKATGFKPQEVTEGGTPGASTPGASPAIQPATTTQSPSPASSTVAADVGAALTESAKTLLSNANKMEAIGSRLYSIEIAVEALKRIKNISRTPEQIGEYAGMYTYFSARMAAIEAEMNAISAYPSEAKTRWARIKSMLDSIKPDSIK